MKAGTPRPTREPLVRAVDLAVGESQSVALADGKTATVKLLGVDEARDPIRSAVREAARRDGYAVSTHRYREPGHDLVRVERTAPGGPRRPLGSAS